MLDHLGRTARMGPVLLAEVVADSDETFVRGLVVMFAAANILGIAMVYVAFNAVMRLVRTFVSLAMTTPSADANCPHCGEQDSFPPTRFGVIGHRQTDRICDDCGTRFAPPIARAKTIAGLILGGVIVATAIVGYHQFTSTHVTSRVFSILLTTTVLFGMSLLFSHWLDLTRSIAVRRRRAR